MCGSGWTVKKEAVPCGDIGNNISARCGNILTTEKSAQSGRRPFQLRPKAKTFSTRGQPAWGGPPHQRLNAEYLSFCRWLVGMTDGDGCFSIVLQNGKYNLNFSIAQGKYNLRILYYIKKILGVGSVNVHKTIGVYRIRDRRKLAEIIFPIFDQYPCLTSKQFHYERLRQAHRILEDPKLLTEHKYSICEQLRSATLPETYVNAVWTANMAVDIDWLTGFIEAEGSFFLYNRDGKQRISIAFGLTQKLDRPLLEAIRRRLHIPTQIIERPHFYRLETTHSRAVLGISQLFQGRFKGMKSLELKLWSRAVYYKKDREKLEQIRSILQRLHGKMIDKGIVRSI